MCNFEEISIELDSSVSVTPLLKLKPNCTKNTVPDSHTAQSQQNPGAPINSARCYLLFQNLSKFGPDVVTPVLQCIYSITEDNADAVNVIREREAALNFFFEVRIN